MCGIPSCARRERKQAPLTSEQKTFAADNHNLIYAFLNRHQLCENEFYDILVFGYLRAVKRYFEEPWLHKYKFSTIAWGGMQSNLKNTFLKRFHQNMEYSTDNVERKGSVGYFDLDSLMEPLWDKLSTRLSEQQLTVLSMKVQGYRLKEIARRLKITRKKARKILYSTRDTVIAVCSATGGEENE